MSWLPPLRASPRAGYLSSQALEAAISLLLSKRCWDGESASRADCGGAGDGREGVSETTWKGPRHATSTALSPLSPLSACGLPPHASFCSSSPPPTLSDVPSKGLTPQERLPELFWAFSQTRHPRFVSGAGAACQPCSPQNLLEQASLSSLPPLLLPSPTSPNYELLLNPLRAYQGRQHGAPASPGDGSPDPLPCRQRARSHRCVHPNPVHACGANLLIRQISRSSTTLNAPALLERSSSPKRPSSLPKPVATRTSLEFGATRKLRGGRRL